MRCVKMVAWAALAGLTFVVPSFGAALDNQKGTPRRPVVASQTQPSAAAAGDFVYVPPPRGAPGGRVGGSTRGTGMVPLVSALAPDHIGLTVQEQVSLFWYLSEPTTYPVELTIIDDHTIQPLIERRISGPLHPGMQRVRLAEYGMHLSPGMPYRWSVALVVDPANRSRDILAGGFIERVAPAEALRAQLAGASRAQAPAIYARAGLWYDALEAISDLIDAAPQTPTLRHQWAALLAQVGLSDIAEHDRGLGRPQ